MIVRLNAKNQRECFDDDQKRLRRREDMHYSIGSHIDILINRITALEAHIASLASTEGDKG